MERERDMNKHKILCLTETHQKVDGLNLSKGLLKIKSHRERTDKKGVGLMVIYSCCEDIEIEKIETKHKDIMLAKCRIFNLKFKMRIVYFSAGNLEADRNRNNLMRIECEEIMSNAKKEESFMILGDFNGHLGFIAGFPNQGCECPALQPGTSFV